MRTTKYAWRLAMLLLLAGAGCGATAPRLLPTWQAPPYDSAGSNKFTPFFFVLAGDPQIGMSPGGPQADRDRFLEVAHQANHLRAPLVLVTGDMTQWNVKSEWDLFDQALGHFESPVKMVMGNHDLIGSIEDDLAQFRSRYGSDYFVHTLNNCDFIGINATILMHADASAYRDEAKVQWEWLEQALATSAAKHRNHIFLLMHQPPFLEAEDEPQKLNGSQWPKDARERLLALTKKYGVHTILAGHRHMNIEGRSNGTRVYVAAGTALTWGGQPRGYRLFKVYADHIEQQLIPLDWNIAKIDMTPGHPPVATQPASSPVTSPTTAAATRTGTQPAN